MMKLIAFAGLLLVAAACVTSEATRESGPPDTVGAVPASDGATGFEPGDAAPAATVVLDPDDPEPVVITGFWSNGPVSFRRPLDLGQFYVYPDGRVIGLRPDSSDPTYAAYELEVSRVHVDRLIEQAAEVGLVGGGSQPTIPLPDGLGVEDGGDSFFVARLDGQLTGRVVEQLGADSRAEAALVPGRVGYVDLYDALTPFFEQLNGGRERLPLDRWAIVSAPAGFEGAERIDDAWSGPDLDEIDWHVINDFSLCAIVTDDDWPLTAADQSSPNIIDGRAVTRRPLLPHENSCGDVAELRRVLDLDGDPGSEPVGLEAHDTARWTGGVDGPVVYSRVAGVPGDRGEISVSGTLELVGECIVLDDSVGDAATARSLLVLPYRTEWLPTLSAVALDNGPEPVRRVGLGERLDLDGGFDALEDLGRSVTDPTALDRIRTCLADPTIDDVFVTQ